MNRLNVKYYQDKEGIVIIRIPDLLVDKYNFTKHNLVNIQVDEKNFRKIFISKSSSYTRGFTISKIGKYYRVRIPARLYVNKYYKLSSSTVEVLTKRYKQGIVIDLQQERGE